MYINKYKKKEIFYSQYGQDKIINKYLNKDNGFFIDIGAYDGIGFSNTYYFEKVRNWDGVCFEPNPTVFQKLISTRKCKCLNIAVSDKNEKVEFIKCSGYVEMLSGISKFRNIKHINRTQTEIFEYGGDQEQIIVDSINLKDFINSQNINNIDLLSIDIEGGEMEVLNSIDNFGIIKVINVEVNYEDDDKNIDARLLKEGFIKLTQAGSDCIYINSNSLAYLRYVLNNLITLRFKVAFMLLSKRIMSYNRNSNY